MNRDGLFTIGEIAKLFSLSTGIIRHYESIGLILPEKTDPETGYRYYSVRQFEPFNTVRYLRTLGMTLDEIGVFLKNRDVSVMREMLMHQREITVKKQAELEKIRTNIDRRLADLDDALSGGFNEVTRSVLAPCTMAVLTRPITLHSGLDLEEPIRELEGSVHNTAVFLGKVGVGISAEKLKKGEIGEYDCVFLMLDEGDEITGNTVSFPSLDCVSVRFSGSHTEAPPYYKKLREFMKQNGLSPAGFSREITLIDYGLTSDTSKFATKISVPVKPETDTI